MKRKKKGKKLCVWCGDKKAIYISKGKARYDRHHDLCPRCWNSIVSRHSVEVRGA